MHFPLQNSKLNNSLAVSGLNEQVGILVLLARYLLHGSSEPVNQIVLRNLPIWNQTFITKILPV